MGAVYVVVVLIAAALAFSLMLDGAPTRHGVASAGIIGSPPEPE